MARPEHNEHNLLAKGVGLGWTGTQRADVCFDAVGVGFVRPGAEPDSDHPGCGCANVGFSLSVLPEQRPQVGAEVHGDLEWLL